MQRGIMMFWNNLISLYLFAVTGGVIYCSVSVRTKNRSDYSKTIFTLSIAICFYILDYIMELNSDTPGQILFWNKLEYVGIPFVSALWMVTAMFYTGCVKKYRKIVLPAVFAIPVISFLLRISNEQHHLYFRSVSFTEKNGKLFLQKTEGPWMKVQGWYAIAMIVAAMVLLLVSIIRNREKQAAKIFLLVLSSMIAVAGLLFDGWRAFMPLDYMAMVLPVCCIFMMMAVSRYDLLETKSIARSKVFEVTGDAILLINRNGRILDYNSSAESLFQKIGVQLACQYLSDLLKDHKELEKILNQNYQNVMHLPIDGREHYFEISTEKIDKKNMLRGFIKTIRDVTEIYQLNKDLKKMAMTDELSGLSNRRAFMSRAREWTARAEEKEKADKPQKELYLLMMDLDHFKEVNDRYGHPAGDLVIQEIAQILRGRFTKDCLIGRLGGEEFAVMLEKDSEKELIAETTGLLHDAAEHIFQYSGKEFHVTISAGAARKQPEELLETMMQRADRALYQSKNSGRNCYHIL